MGLKLLYSKAAAEFGRAAITACFELRRFSRQGAGRRRFPEVILLIRQEEEQFVFNDRSAERSTELVEAQGLPVNASLIQEERVGVIGVVAIEFPTAAVIAIRAGFGYQVGHGTGAVAILRRHVQSELLEFLNGVFNWLVDCAAAKAFVRSAIDQEAVKVFAQTVDDSVCAVLTQDAAHIHRAGRQLHEVINVTAIERQICHLV